MNNPRVIYKTALAVFKDHKMLMVRDSQNDTAFYTLGGTIEEGETGIECLHREVEEEVNTKIKDGSLQFLKEFEAPAHGKENTLVNIKLYKGELVDEPAASNEIVEIQYFNTNVDKKHLTAITIDMFKWLKEQGYLS